MSTYTESLGLELITPGSQAGLWGNTTNNTFNLIDQAITGVTPISFAAASGTTYTLTDYNGAEDEARSAVLNVTGTASGANTIIIPNKQKTYFVRNSTGKDIIVQTALGTTPCTVGAGYNLPVFCDGNNEVFLAIVAPGAGTLTVTGGGTGVTTFGSGGFVKSPGSSNPLTVASAVALGSEVSGTLPVANGGTGLASPTAGAVLIGNGTGSLAAVTGGTPGYVLTWNGSTWAPAAQATGVSSISAGAGIAVSGSTGAVTVSNNGVTSISAGSGISVSGSSGAITISASGTSGVSSFNSRSGAVTPQSYDYSSYYGQLGSSNTWSSTNTFNNVVYFNASSALKCQAQAYNFSATDSIWANPTSSVNIAVATLSYWTFSAGGTATCPNWVSTSDARIKENVQDVDGALVKLNQLRPVAYSLKLDGRDKPNRYGFIAQEVEPIYPNLVQNSDIKLGDVENVKGISYNDMVALLVKAVQELKAEIDALKAAK